MSLVDIQNELKAPKGQRNSFGNYNYRSCEDILEAVKPILKKYKHSLMISDTIEEIAGRVYVKATATLLSDKGTTTIVSAYAREPESKKGMDESQITGATSSYARKYALNGLFCIDDTKDADTDEYKKKHDNNTSSLQKVCKCGKEIKGNYDQCYTCSQKKVSKQYDDPFKEFNQ